MRIGFDVQFLRFSRSGIGSYIRHVYDSLVRLTPAGTVLPFVYGPPGLREPKELDQLVALNHTRQLHYYWDGSPLRLLTPDAQADRHLRFARRLDSWIGRFWRLRSTNKVDVYHHTGPIVLPPHRLRSNVLTLYDVGTLRVPQYQCRENIEPWNDTFRLASQMDGLVAISEFTKREAVELLGVNEDLIDVTPLAAHEQYQPIEDPERVRGTLAQYGLANQPYLIHLGTLEPRKNLCRVIKAFHGLVRQDPGLEHQLLLVGEKGWMYEPIFETIRELHMESRVRWLDYVPFEELPALLNGAHLLVYPSLYEGFGLPVLEGMSCGTPVIASSTTSLPEVAGDAGILVNPESVEDLAAAMRRVLTDPTLRATLRAKGLARARTFSWERTARLTWAAYEKAYQRSCHPARKEPSRETAETKAHEIMRGWILERAIETASAAGNR